MESLLKAGAEKEAQEKEKYAPLHYAAEHGHAEVVESLLKAGANIEAQDEGKWTPLHWAARHGQAEVVESLLKNGAEKEAQDVHKCTPLHVAVHYNQDEMVKLLLAQEGVDRGAVDNEGNTPLIVACARGDVVLLQRLLRTGRGVTIDGIPPRGAARRRSAAGAQTARRNRHALMWLP